MRPEDVSGAPVVLSTGCTAPHPRCLSSVREQTVLARHIVRDDPAVSYAANVLEVVSSLAPETVVIALDADDWLAVPHAVERVCAEHDAGAWVTYGSYVFADGRLAAWQRAYTPEELEHVRRPVDRRRSDPPWLASHLKSFRAGLVQQLLHARPDELDLEHGRDQALMFALIEMAGPERVRFVPESLYVYNWAASFEFSATPAELAEEAAQVASIRARAPMARIEALS